jgi:hypothetical protein
VTVGQAPQTFLFGSVSGSWVAFALFGAIAAVIGVGVTRALGRFAAADDALPYYGTTRTARRVIGGLTVAALFAAIWWWLWSGFYVLEVGRDSVRMRFQAPPRSRLVPKSEIAATRWEPGPRSTRTLVIETRSGDAYRSMQTSSNAAFEQRVTRAVSPGLGG